MLHSVLEHGYFGSQPTESFQPRGGPCCIISLRRDENPVDGRGLIGASEDFRFRDDDVAGRSREFNLVEGGSSGDHDLVTGILREPGSKRAADSAGTNDCDFGHWGRI